MLKWFLIRAIYHIITNSRVNGMERINPFMDFSAKLGKYTYVNVCKISRLCGAIIFVSFQQITLKLGNWR